MKHFTTPRNTERKSHFVIEFFWPEKGWVEPTLENDGYSEVMTEEECAKSLEVYAKSDMGQAGMLPEFRPVRITREVVVPRASKVKP